MSLRFAYRCFACAALVALGFGPAADAADTAPSFSLNGGPLDEARVRNLDGRTLRDCLVKIRAGRVDVVCPRLDTAPGTSTVLVLSRRPAGHDTGHRIEVSVDGAAVADLPASGVIAPVDIGARVGRGVRRTITFKATRAAPGSGRPGDEWVVFIASGRLDGERVITERGLLQFRVTGADGDVERSYPLEVE